MNESDLDNSIQEEGEERAEEIMDVTPEDEIPHEPEQAATAKPSFFSRIFSKETKIGRTMRMVLRWAVVCVVCFGLGVLAAYLVLYQPVKKSLEEIKATQLTVEAERDTLTADLTKAREDLTAQQTKAREELSAMQEDNQKLDDSLKYQSSYVAFLELDNQVLGMMYSLASEDMATAKVMMVEAKKSMEAFQPALQEKDSVLASLINDRLNVASSEVDLNKGEDALNDLRRLRESFNLVRKTLFPE